MASLSFALALALSTFAPTDVPDLPPAQEKLHDPLADACEQAGPTGKELLEALQAYDVVALKRIGEELEARAGKPEAQPLDDYFLAQAKLGLLAIKRFHELDLPSRMPESLRELELDAVADAALLVADRFAAANPNHSDIHRVRGELWSAKIRGMTGGMTHGPKAREAIEKALELDNRNSLAWLGQARMHYHNPAFVGGDKDLALVEFRRVFEDTQSLRACLYLARVHRDTGLYTQARFFAKKAQRIAPRNPEAAFLLEDAEAKSRAKESGR